jgi:hypothetical protein
MKGAALLCAIAPASATPPVQDPRLLSLVPPGAEIVAGITVGLPLSHLVATRNNTTDLMDFESFAAVDADRMTMAVILIAASGTRGFVSEHSLLASGRFDTKHIFKAAKENGATESEYLGVPVLIIPPLDRDKGVSDDVRWFAVIDSQIAVFGTIPMVREELSRSLARSQPDPSLIRNLSRLRSNDQSWCFLSSSLQTTDLTRRWLATLDPARGQADFVNDGVIMGIHFGKQIEIELENVPDSANTEVPLQSQPEASQTPRPGTVPPTSQFVPNSDTTVHKVIRLSKKQYDQWTLQEQAREQNPHRTGSLATPYRRKTPSIAEEYRHIDPSIEMRRRYPLWPERHTHHHPTRSPTAAAYAAQRLGTNRDSVL